MEICKQKILCVSEYLLAYFGKYQPPGSMLMQYIKLNLLAVIIAVNFVCLMETYIKE